MIKKTIARTLALTFFVSFSSLAGTVIQDLSACDASFFTQMKSNKQISELIHQSNTGNIKEKENVAIDAKNYRDGDLTLNKYISRYSNMNKHQQGSGEYYFWGFETSENYDSVINKIGKQVSLLNNGGIYIHNPMIKEVSNAQWSINSKPSAGTLPGKKVAEKLFFIEKNKDGTTSLLCTLQGIFSDADLKAARPDLK